MFAALPTRPEPQLWNERKNIYLQLQRNTSKSQLASTHRHPHIDTKTPTQRRVSRKSSGSCGDFIGHKLWIYPAALFSCWQVTQGFRVWPRRKETHETAAHQWNTVRPCGGFFLMMHRRTLFFFFLIKYFFRMLPRFAVFILLIYFFSRVWAPVEQSSTSDGGTLSVCNAIC